MSKDCILCGALNQTQLFCQDCLAKDFNERFEVLRTYEKNKKSDKGGIKNEE